MGIFQWLYDFFRKLNIPAWLKPYVQELNNLMIEVLKQAGQSYLNFLKAKIIEAAQNNSLTPKEKFDYVFGAAKSGLVSFAITLKDNELNTIINYLVSRLKKDNII